MASPAASIPNVPAVHPAVFDPARVPPAERARLATLAAVAALDGLRRDYVLKGGLVLHYVYGSPRPSSDLDFNHVRRHPSERTPAHDGELQAFCDRVGAALPTFAEAYGLETARLRIQKWSRGLPIVFAGVGYRADGEEGEVELQVTLCERICRTVGARIGGVEVHAAALEDLVADKLKALLQQAPRHQIRESDVYDLWYALVAAPLVVDPADVGPILRAKAAVWPDLSPLTPARYRDEAVRSFAEAGYRKLRVTRPDLPFPPFDAVWAAILDFVDALGLDEG
jgi:hypothetical protein